MTDGRPAVLLTDESWGPAWRAAASYLDLVATAPRGIRRCESPSCVLHFFDPTGRRRWCSMAGCGNRAKARRHHARRRTPGPAGPAALSVRHPRGTLAVLTAAAFLIFGQAFMVAPILPRLAKVFDADVGVVGLSVPAYLVPYGVVTLVWGPAADRFGRRPIILVALACLQRPDGGDADVDVGLVVHLPGASVPAPSPAVWSPSAWR